MAALGSSTTTKFRLIPNSVSPAASAAVVLLGLLLFLLLRFAPEDDFLNGRIISEQFALSVLGVTMLVILVTAWVPVLLTYLRGVSRRLLRSSIRVLAYPGRLLSVPLSAIDAVLGSVFGRIGGSTQPKLWGRYTILVSVLTLCVTGAAFLDQPWALLSLGGGFLVVLGVYRRWLWIEDDRDLFVLNPVEVPHGKRGPFRVGFDQDLTDEALTSFVFLFALVPCALQQFATEYGGFSNVEGSHWGDWFLFMAGELVKAVPFVDWSEVYGIRNGAAIEVSSGAGQNAVFVMRVIFDLLLIAGVLQGIGVSRRVARQRRRLDDKEIDLVDPFLERQLLAATADYTLDLDEFFYVPSGYRVTRLIDVLNNGENLTLVRQGAARWLGNYNEDERGYGPLTAVAGDENEVEEVRISCIWALTSFDAEGCTEFLIELLESHNLWVRITAIGVLGARRDSKAVEPLIEILRRKQDSEDAYFGERHAAASSLGMLGDTRAVKPLMEVLGDESESSSLRVRAAYALGWLRAREALELLRTIVESTNDQRLRRAAEDAIDRIEQRADRVRLRSVSGLRSPKMRMLSMSWLARAGGNKFVDLIESVNRTDPHPTVRRFALVISRELSGTRSKEGRELRFVPS